MRLPRTLSVRGFSIVEVMVGASCGLFIIAAVLTAGVALQRSYAAVQAYSIAEGDQLRVQDYIAMDCRRAIAASVAGSTLTLLVPSFYSSTGSTVVPSYDSSNNVLYGGRRVSDGVTVAGTATITSASAAFTNADVGKVLISPNFANPTKILSVTNATTAIATSNAMASGTSQVLSIGTAVVVNYYTSGTSFYREANGTTKAIATNIDSFTVTPADLTASVTCSITFAPRFVSLPGAGPVNGTTIYSNTFLRNSSARQ